MNGPEHYRAAEKLIERAHDFADQHPDDARRADFILSRAQAHATLALAAATAADRVQYADGDGRKIDGVLETETGTDWYEVLGG